jgi:hypothetical protein
MNEINVGKILNFTYDTEKKSLRVLIEITDDAFKEQILRNYEMTDKIKFVGENVMYISNSNK